MTAKKSDPSRLRYESAPARRERILDVVRERAFCNVVELADLLDVSEMTVRRDFRTLADLGLVRQVHGGVSAITSLPGPIDFRLRAAEHQSPKRVIAAAAVAAIERGSVVGLDAGTTTLEVARQLHNDIRLTVVTHSLPALAVLGGRESLEIIGLGGHLHSDTQAFAGATTIRSIADIRLSTLLLAATAVRDGSMWCTNTFDADTKQALIRAADRTVLLVDSSKFNATAAMRVGSLDSLQTVITDSNVDRQVVRNLERVGLEVQIVEVKSPLEDDLGDQGTHAI